MIAKRPLRMTLVGLSLIILGFCTFNSTSKLLNFSQANAGDSADKSVTWLPVFSPKPIRLIPQCSEVDASCGPLSRRVNVQYEYETEIIHTGTETIRVTYPAVIGGTTLHVDNGSYELEFDYFDTDDDVGDVDVDVCHCPSE